MQLFDKEKKLTIDLFHGTSTLFLDSIIQNGLGGVNPVIDWKLLELSKEVYELSEKHLQGTELFNRSSFSFKQMSEQSKSGSFNFQHGNSYLSPSQQTASNYAINKEFGSEMLTYTILFLKELLSRDIPYVKNELFRKFPKVFRVIESKPSPLIIQVKNVSASSLLDEHGNDPQNNFELLQECIDKDGEIFDLLSQQTNFRLIKAVPKNNLKFWIINVQNYDMWDHQYNLYEIVSESIKRV